MMDVKEVDDMETQDEETRQIQKIVSCGFLPNLGFTVMKAALAFLPGSLAITASTIDSLTDFVASPVLYVGLKPLSLRTLMDWAWAVRPSISARRITSSASFWKASWE
jgi:hypothetical protein